MLSTMREAMASKDPQAQKLWKKLAPNGKEPTLDEFLEFAQRGRKIRNVVKSFLYAQANKPPPRRGLDFCEAKDWGD